MKKAVFTLMLCAMPIWAINAMQYMLSGRVNGHMGAYYQLMTRGSPTFADVNLSLEYKTPNLRGIDFGISGWGNVKVYQAKGGDFAKTKDPFVLTELYGRFINPGRISIYAGRFKTNSEWIKHYTQGASVLYEDVQNVKVEAIWAMRNAYVTDYRVDNFYNPYNRNIGSFYTGATILIEDSNLQITPYIYAAPSSFTSFGANVLVEVPVNDFFLYGKMHFLSFLSKSNQIIDASSSDGDGGFVWLEGGARLYGIRAGGGIISVAKNGARGIDSFGQSSAFERREGLFYNNATTIYGLLEYEYLRYATIESAIRNTSINGKNIFNWEAGIISRPQSTIEIGAKVIGMINGTGLTLDNHIFASDGRNYLLGRVYAKVKFGPQGEPTTNPLR